MKIKLSSIIFWGLILGGSIRLGFSNHAMNYFYAYASDGGPWYLKIHPSTYLVIFITIIAVSRIGAVRLLFNSECRNIGILQFICVLLLIIVVSIFRHRTMGLGYLIDTYIVAMIGAILMYQLPDTKRYKIATCLIYLVCINSVIALYEYLEVVNIIPIKEQFNFFRSTALFGHPLTNGLITSFTIFATLKTAMSQKMKLFIVIIMYLSLFSFGARAAMLVVTIGLMVYLLFVGGGSNTDKQKKISIIFFSYTLLIIFIVTFLIVLFYTDLGSSILSRISMDSSIQARLASVSFLNHFTFHELFNGVSNTVLTNRIEAVPNFYIIENYWIVILLTIGIPLFLMYAYTFLFMLYQLVKNGTMADYLLVLCFLLVSGSNNSLSSKNAALFVLMLIVIGLQGRPSVSKRLTNPGSYSEQMIGSREVVKG